METATLASGIVGEKLYQQRARVALPVLVRQAQAGTTIRYGELAAELGMANPRNLNFVLGCVGQAINDLSREWGQPIPPIQCIVTSKRTGWASEGVGWF